MKLIELLDKIKIDDCVVQDAIDNIVDSVLMAELEDYRERRIEDYECVTNGSARSIYVHGDLEQDALEISRRIEAVDLIISEYTVGHEPYDFDTEEYEDGSA
jgi:hypothetical protein